MKEWLWAIGGLYVLLGAHFMPAINASQFTRVLRGWTAARDTTEFKAVVDWEWTFGLDLVAIGVVAIVAAAMNVAGLAVMVWVIAARELLGGIVADMQIISGGYADRRVYAGFIVLHVVIIASGLLVIPR